MDTRVALWLLEMQTPSTPGEELEGKVLGTATQQGLINFLSPSL